MHIFPLLQDYSHRLIISKVSKGLEARMLELLSINGNQETTQEPTYKKELVSEINDTEGLPEGIFSIIKLVEQYQQIDPILKGKYEIGAYQKGSFC